MSIRNQVTGDLPNITTYTAEGSIVDINLPGNVNAGGNVSATGNVNGHGLTVQGEAIITGNANVQGTLTYNNVTNITTANLVLGLGNTQTGINVDGGGMVVGNTAEASFTYDQPTSSWNSNIGISAVGNIEAPYFIGDGSQLTGLPAGYSDSDVGNYLASGGATGNFVTTGNISGAYFIGDGSQLTGLPANYGNTQVAEYLGSNSAINITTTGNISATQFIGDGNLLTNVQAKSSIVNGSSQARVYANGNITMSVNGTANVATFAQDGLHVAGNIYDATGQVYGVAAGYMSAQRSTQQTTGLSNNSPVLFDTVSNTFGTDITLDTATGRFTLEGGKTYRLMASPGYASFSGSGYVIWQWYNVTAGAYFGNKFSADSLTTTGNIAPSFGPTVVLFTPTVTTTIQLNIVTQSSLTALGLNTGTMPYADIQVIGGQAPIIGVKASNFYATFATQPARATNGSIIKFNGGYASTGTDVTYDGATGIFTLQPGTYSLTAGLSLSNDATNIEMAYLWVNQSTGAGVGSSGAQLVNNNTSSAAWQPTAQAVVTLTAPTQFCLKSTYVNAGGGLINGAQSYAFINQIAGQVPVTGGTNVAASFAKYTRGAQQTTGLTANSRIICDVLDALTGDDINVNTTTGQITLRQGKTYRLSGTVPGFTGTGDIRVSVCWYNETAGSWIGNSAEAYNAVSGANFGTFGGAAEAIITPQTTTVVSFRLLSSFGSISGLGGNSDFVTTGSYPWIDIEVIGGYSPITNVRTQEYLQAVRINTDQANVVANTDLIFNSVTARNGNVSLDTTTGVVTLSAGTTYQLSVEPSWFQFSSNAAYIDYTWVDATTNVPLNSNIRAVATPQTYTQNETNQLSATVIYTPSSNQTVKPRVTSASPGGSAVMRSLFSSITVEQIGCGYLTPNNTGSWTVAPGANTLSLSLPLNGTFTVWVLGNIPNGIVTYNATVTVTNPNVPLLGTQYGWYYAAGNALVLTSIPSQIIGTAGGISNALPAVGTTTNVLNFGITNNSGSSQTITWGYTKM